MIIVELNEARAWSMVAESAGLELRVLSGTVWVTQAADGQDHVLTAHGAFVTAHAGRVAVQALTPARIAVTPTVPVNDPLAAAA